MLAGLAFIGQVPEAAISTGDQVARIHVEDVIFHDPYALDVISEIGEAEGVKALLVHIDSPGGTVVGGETLYKALRDVAADKPVVALMGELATSAGYMTAIGADRIYAHEGTITGSIGVIMQTADLTGLLDKLGIKPETIKSGELKAVPNPLEPMTERARTAVEATVVDFFGYFKGLVQDRRGYEASEIERLADGRVYTGRQALENRLIDAIGDEGDALDWLVSEQGLDAEIPVVDWNIVEPEDSLEALLGAFSGKALVSEILTLDGLISLWHPAR